MRERVLLIGLDSGDADLIDRWCRAGHLPALESLRREGTWTRVGTTSDVLHVSAWPTLYTGAHPGHHGLYHAYQIRGGEQDVHRTRADELGLPTFWQLMDEAGVDCVVLDAFMDHLLRDFRGVQILEYGTWTWFDEPAARPDGLWKELVRRFGPYPAPEHTKVHGQPEPARFRDQLVAGARVKGEATRWLMKDKPWQMMFVSFAEPHPAGHYLWHVADPDYPTYPGSGLGLDDAVLDVYRAVDDAIGGILEDVDDSTTVLVVSGDGMGPNFSGCHLVPEFLHRLDLYHAADVGRDEPTEEATGARPRQSAASFVRGLVPVSFRRAVSRCLPPSIQHRLSMKWANADIDWTRTRAFVVPNANEGYVRINTIGREPEGTVAAGDEYMEHVALVKRRLEELVNPETQRRAAHRVFHIEDVFPGPRRHDLPDVIVTWDEEARVLADVQSEACGRIHKMAGHETAPYYTGNHRPAAFVLARGPSVEAGRSREAGHLVDLAPTLLTMMGVDVPSHMEGEVWGELLGQRA